jgi:putative sigma-54 modulation protein
MVYIVLLRKRINLIIHNYMNVQVSFLGMGSSDALKSYLDEKLTKHEELFKSATSVKAEFIESVSSKGVKNDFRFEINVHLPNALVRVEERGEDMYALVDKATDVLTRRVKRYLDKQSNWDGVTPWSDLEAQQDLEEDVIEVEDNYIGYVPKISIRKNMDSMSPMFESEAIERMELLGDRQILFKNSQTGKISMIYKNERGQYCLVQPSDI